MGLHHDHHPAPRRANSRVLLLAFALTGGYAAIEALVGWLSGSLALLADAAHMVSDTVALGLAATAASLARRPATSRYSFGLGRAEVVAATINATLLLVIVAGIAWAAVDRLRNPVPVAGGAVLAVATAGLLLNVGLAWLLSRGEQTLNVRAAMLNVIGDALGSVAAITSGAVILMTGWMPIDPILSLFICALILIASVRLLREALAVVMEAVPRDIELPIVERAIAGIVGVRQVHDLHVWQVATGDSILTAHLAVDSLAAWPSVHESVLRMLKAEFNITRVTLQPEVVAP
ncbi:MAG: cation diffusion facilitator family transporter [Gammaproteobacteria bacterium]